METFLSCPICSSNHYSNFIICKDYTVSQKKFTIAKCDSCNHLFTNPRPTQNEIGEYYKAESYVSHTDTKKGAINRLYHFIRSFSLKQKEALITELNGNTKGKLFDFGAGTGYFLNHCKQQGWNVSGFEPDTDALQLCNQKGINVSNNLEGIADTLDIITAWHVIEHVYNPIETITKLKDLCKSNGYLVIALPNHKSYDAQLYKQHWAAYDLPRHIQHFNKKTFEKLIKTVGGLDLVQVNPMVFDSYYISLMSETYKGNKFPYIKAFINGFISNQKAKETTNYSSLIYVVKKV